MKFTGDGSTERFITGLYSLDRACMGEETSIGLPYGIAYQVFGATGVGKSTFAYGLSGYIANYLNGNIALCDFEGFDKNFISSILSSTKFDNELRSVSDKEDGIQLGMLIDLLDNEKKNFVVGIVDSVAAVSSEAEQRGALEEAKMGRRAHIMNGFCRQAMHTLRWHPGRTLFLVNHWYKNIGMFGYSTPGGNGKEYLTTVHMLIKRLYTFPDGSYVLSGKIRKNRWGYVGRNFTVFMLSGMGIHAGLTAVWDCVLYKIAKYKEKDREIVMDTQDPIRLSTLVKSAKAGEDVFHPFREALEKLNGTQDIGTENEGNDTGEVDEVSN